MSGPARKALGGALFVYAILYTTHVVFNPFYSDQISTSDVYQIMNPLTAIGILISAAVAWRHKPASEDASVSSGHYLAAQAGFYLSLVLAILFFTLWFRGLNDEPSGAADNMAWYFVAVLHPLVLGTTGTHLWKSTD
ncbi:MAG: hypothetical protein OXH95_02760 [bacterium]|nr:hypothetical protein [bacterium]